MPEVRSGEVQVGFFHQPIGRRFEASGHRCWRWWWLDDRTLHVLDQGCPLARKANFWPDPTPSTLSSQLDHYPEYLMIWLNEYIIYCWKTVWQQVGIHEHPKVPARETWSVSRHLKVSDCFYWSFQISLTSRYRISWSFLKIALQDACCGQSKWTIQRQLCYVSSWMSSDGILSMKKFNCARDCACLLSPQ